MSLISNILRNNRTFAVVGVSQDRQKYGHEVFETLLAGQVAVETCTPLFTDEHQEKREQLLALIQAAV